jgi:peroxiredoxin
MGTRNYKTYLVTMALVPAMLLMAFSGVSSKAVNDFSLKNVNGKAVSLKNYPHAKGFIIVFTCNHCPFAKLYYNRMNELDKHYKKLGVPLIAISSADTVNYEEDSYEKMVALANKQHFSFPYLYDAMQVVAKDYDAKKTPHAYVVWKEQGKWMVKYNGAIDDDGAHADLVKNAFIAKAVDELLAGKEVTVKETKSVGCGINLRKQ